MKLYNKIFLLTLIVYCTSCKKFITVDPPDTQLTGKTVFSNDETALSAIYGLYSKMAQSPSGSFANYKITLYTGLSSDEFIDMSFDPSHIEFNHNSLLSTNRDIERLWNEGYTFIYSCNAIMEGISTSSSISLPIKKQLEGEAKFLRGFLHFYLGALYGDVPYITSTDFEVNKSTSRLPLKEVYDHAIEDIAAASLLLPSNYNNLTDPKVRPTKWAAIAMLSRLYLYEQNFSKAEEYSSMLIDGSDGNFSIETDLDDVFLRGSKEEIWQLAPVTSQYNTWDGYNFIPSSAPINIVLTNELISSFEQGDKRKIYWIKPLQPDSAYYIPFKYKVRSGSTVTEFTSILRLAEQYLIRSESRANLNKLESAAEDLNVIRLRAGIDARIVNDKDSLLSLIERERRVELFAELGHRWLDVIRTQKADSIFGLIKGVNWQSYDIRYPVPQRELENNPAFIQNQGY